MSGKFDDFLQGQLQDPGIRREYEALQAEHAVNQAMIDDAEGACGAHRDCPGGYQQIGTRQCQPINPNAAAAGERDGDGS